MNKIQDPLAQKQGASKIENGEPEVDEYTARMDRMVEGLKKRSKSEHHQQLQTTLIWLLIGILVIMGSVYILLNMSWEGEPLKFLQRP